MEERGKPAPAADRLEALRSLTARAGLDSVPWLMLLVWLMRLLALFWIAKGLSSWAVIVGAWSGTPPFDTRSTGYQAIHIYFAVIDLVAAVGLWLTSTWGGVMWLLAAMSHLILAMLFPAIVPSNVVLIAALVAFIAAYFVISWFAVPSGE